MQSNAIQGANPTLPSNTVFRILQDNAEGHSVGWNPNGVSKTFVISDYSINPQRSIVLINTVTLTLLLVPWTTLLKGFLRFTAI